MPHTQFYALASRLHRDENTATARQMDATKTAVEAFWHGKQEILDKFFQRYQIIDTKQAQPQVADDRLPDGRQKSNLNGFKALALVANKRLPKQ